MLYLFAAALAVDPTAVAAGQALYAANCTACHGTKGDGKGPAAIALKPKPNDLTQASWWAGKTDEQIVAAIRGGRPGTSMTGFTSLTDTDLSQLVAYLRTLAPAP